MREGLKKVLLKWGELNRSAPHLISAILFGINSWRKRQLTYPSTPLPFSVFKAFKNQEEIGWIQALMGITAYNWAEIKNIHLQYIGAKTTGKIWISSLIREFWDTAWDV